MRQPGASHYAVGIFVDSPAHYANADLLERYVTQPAILAAFGWKVMLVLARDWYFEPEAVIERIERLMHGAASSEPAAEDLPEQADHPPFVPGVSDGQDAKADPTAEVPVTTRRLELAEGTSHKFWEVTCRGDEVITRFGRIGSKGQMHAKTFRSPQDAEREMERLAAEKLRKGYTET